MTRYLNEVLHLKEREAVANEHECGINERYESINKRKFEKLIDEGNSGTKRRHRFENELVPIPNAEREGILRRGRLFDLQLQDLNVIHCVQVLWMENGRSGLEGLARHRHGGDASPDAAVALEHSDFGGGSGGRRVFAEEVSDGGATDASADDADVGGGWRRWIIGMRLSLGECEEQGQQEREFQRHHL